MGTRIVYRGSRMQRGSGLGQLLVNAAKTVIPIIARGGKTIAKTAGKAASRSLMKNAASKALTLAKDKNPLKAIGGTAATAAIGELANMINKKRKAPSKPAIKQPPKKKPIKQLAIEAPPAKFQSINQRQKMVKKKGRRRSKPFKTIFDN